MTGEGRLKILLGVCGHGYGHCSRQLEIARRLIAMGHSIRIVTFGRGHRFFADTEFADVVSPVAVPWIDCDSSGIRWRATARMNLRTCVPGTLQNVRTFRQLSADFRPDVCVADYEPVIARFARLWRVPLLTIDQSSKYLGYQMPSVGGLSREEERSRLAVFFPRADKRLATSFYTVEVPRDERFQVELVPPIIKRSITRARAEVAHHPPERRVTAYLSSYPEKGSYVDQANLVRILSTFEDWQFRIYSQDTEGVSQPAPNVVVRPPADEDFVDDLTSSQGLICTAGHTLLSEAMTLGLPVLAMPLFTYDQHLCAHLVEELGVGVGLAPGAALTREHVGRFLEGLPTFRGTIASSPRLARGDLDATLTTVCEEIVGLGLEPQRSQAVGG